MKGFNIFRRYSLVLFELLTSDQQVYINIWIAVLFKLVILTIERTAKVVIHIGNHLVISFVQKNVQCIESENIKTIKIL